jgi:two-component system, cell cycle sensor histidine kinase and response regulator CckA
MKRATTSRLSPPLRVSLLYAAFGVAWIWLGDLRLLASGGMSTSAWLLSVGKGLLFVAGSAALIYALVRREVAAHEGAESARLQVLRLDVAARLAGGVAHEFNNILTAILGHATLLSDSFRDDPERREHVDAVRQAAARATELTRQLLVFSGSSVASPALLDLGAVIRDLDRALLRSAGGDVALELHLADRLWAVRADPAQLHQLLLNLATNAKQAMPGGGTLRIETRNVALDGPAEPADVPRGEYVLLRVADTGPGMDEQSLERLFEPFSPTQGHGAGLGLSTVYGIVRQWGAHIRVRSRPAAGATFDIYLPRASASGTPPVPADVRREATATLLVVEDDDAVRDLTGRILRRRGHEVLSARSGEEALSVMRGRADVRLVVADILMPGMTGLELGSRLREQRPDLPILYTSGYAAGSLHDASQLGPGTDFMEKPFGPDELLSRIDRLLATAPA